MATKNIDLEQLPRRDLFEFYRRLDYPHFSVCAEVDLSKAYDLARDRGLSVFTTILYIITQAANSIPELRFRIRGEGIVEHDAVHPSFTVLNQDNTFGFCEVKYSRDVARFFRETRENIQAAKENPKLKDEEGRDDYLFLTSLPWTRFTSVSHPIHMTPPDSVPRITWGKYESDNGKMVLPLSIQAHHALVDGYHVGLFFQLVQEAMDEPGPLFAGV